MEWDHHILQLILNGKITSRFHRLILGFITLFLFYFWNNLILILLFEKYILNNYNKQNLLY